MNADSNGLLFFYGFFWALAMSGASRYEAFATASISFSRGGRRSLYRFLVALAVLVFLPVAFLLYLYECWVPETASAGGVANAAISSLAVFGFLRLFHAFVASTATYKGFYTSEEVAQVRDRGKFNHSQSFAAHFVPGIAYCVVAPALGTAAQRVIECIRTAA